MTLCRCLEKMHAWPKGLKQSYVAYVYPIGYPDTSSICGRRDCDKPGVLWLTDGEVDHYNSGVRIFMGPNNFTKMKADDRGLFTR